MKTLLMKNICAIHQPNFLPWLGYFYKIAKADMFVILDTVDIQIGTAKAITNRCKIKTNNGVVWLTIPIKKSDSKRIKDIEIVQNNWQNKILKTISQQYGKAENFKNFWPIFEAIIAYESESLSEYNTNAIRIICKYLNIETTLILASEMNVKSMDRNTRIIDICKEASCNTYFSGKGGANYHDENKFYENKIEIQYTQFEHPVYNQLYGDFVAGLSIVDYLFSNGLEDLKW